MCRGGDSPRFNLDLQDRNGVEHPLVSLLFVCFLRCERFLGSWIWIRCWRRSLRRFLQVHNSYFIYKLHFDSQICLTHVHDVSLLCCLWKALHFKKCKNCATFYMSVCDHLNLIFAWVEVSCWFALVEGGAWCFRHHCLKRWSFLHWLTLCLCQNSVDCPRMSLLWTCPQPTDLGGVRPLTDPRGLSPRGPGASLGAPVRFLQLLPFGFYFILPFILAFLAPFSLHVF